MEEINLDTVRRFRNSFYDIFSELGLAPPWWEVSKHLAGYKPE